MAMPDPLTKLLDDAATHIALALAEHGDSGNVMTFVNSGEDGMHSVVGISDDLILSHGDQAIRMLARILWEQLSDADEDPTYEYDEWILDAHNAVQEWFPDAVVSLFSGEDLGLELDGYTIRDIVVISRCTFPDEDEPAEPIPHPHRRGRTGRRRPPRQIPHDSAPDK